MYSLGDLIYALTTTTAAEELKEGYSNRAQIPVYLLSSVSSTLEPFGLLSAALS